MEQTIGVYSSLEEMSERKFFTRRLRTAQEIYYDWPVEALLSPRRLLPFFLYSVNMLGHAWFELA